MVSPRHHPQRLAPPASPGALLKRLCALDQRRRAREATEREPSYLVLIRRLPCLKCGLEPCNEAAHVRMQSGIHNKHGGMGKKPADKWALPLCAGCHWRDTDAQHRLGELEFWRRLDLDPLLCCQRLHAARGDFVVLRATALALIGARR